MHRHFFYSYCASGFAGSRLFEDVGVLYFHNTTRARSAEVLTSSVTHSNEAQRGWMKDACVCMHIALHARHCLPTHADPKKHVATGMLIPSHAMAQKSELLRVLLITGCS